MALADVVVEAQEPSASVLSTQPGADNALSFFELRTRADNLIQRAVDALIEQGFPKALISTELSYNCRFQGTSTTLMIREPEGGDEEFVASFMQQHEQLFGFILQGRAIHVDDVRVRGVAQSSGLEQESPYKELKILTMRKAVVLKTCQRKKVYFDVLGWTDTAVVPLADIAAGEQVSVCLELSPLFLTTTALNHRPLLSSLTKIKRSSLNQVMLPPPLPDISSSIVQEHLPRSLY